MTNYKDIKQIKEELDKHIQENLKELAERQKICEVNKYRLELNEQMINNLKESTEELLLNVSKLTDKITLLTEKEDIRKNTKNKILVGIIIGIITAIFSSFIALMTWLINSNMEYYTNNQRFHNKEMTIEIIKHLKEELKSEFEKEKEKEKENKNNENSKTNKEK